MTLRDHALDLCNGGYSVIPVHAPGMPLKPGKVYGDPGKFPLIPWTEFRHRPPTDKQVRDWWTVWPNANIGVVTGAASGAIVLDVDGKEGIETLKGFSIPETCRCETGSGWHYWFNHPGGIVSNSTRLLPGIDLRGDGGFVVVPPSVHRTGRTYTWQHSDGTPLADPPGWLMALIQEPSQKSVAAESVHVGPIIEGTRNDTLHRMARRLRHTGLSPGGIDAALQHENRERCDPPLTVEEVTCLAQKAMTQRDRLVPPLSQSDEEVILIPADQIVPRSVTWVWNGRVPLRAITVLAGDPGLGKSTIALDLAACLSRGRAEGDLFGQAVSSLIASAEDAPAQSLIPRLMAAEANLGMVHIVEVHRQGLVSGLTLEPKVLTNLAERMREVDAKLLVIDPLSAHLPAQVNSWRDQDIRRVLSLLSQLAENLAAAVLLIVHLNKREEADVLARVSGSMGIVAAARSVLFAGPDQQAPNGETRLLAHAKCNLGPCSASLRYKIEARTMTVDDGESVTTSRSVWLGVAPGVSSSDLLSRPDQGRGSKRQAAEAWLRRLLIEGSRSQEDIAREADQVGFSWGTVRRAKESLGIKGKKQGFEGPWMWELPSSQGAQTNEDEAHRVWKRGRES